MAQKPTDPLSIDFAALNTLHNVSRFQSFTRAAEALGVNQSAVSYTIEKLRTVFNDPLFVREGHQQVPTVHCKEILDNTHRLLAEFLQLTEPKEFDPKIAKSQFVIACNYYERVVILPNILRALRQRAPGLEIEIINADDAGHERLLDARADLLLGPFQQSRPAFHRRKLFDEQYACVMDKSHPNAKPDLTIKEYAALDHVRIMYGGAWQSSYIAEVEAMGLALNFALRVPSPAGIQELIAGTTITATIPARLANKIGSDLHICQCPIPSPFDIYLVWTARTDKSALHKWVRDLVAQTVKNAG